MKKLRLAFANQKGGLGKTTISVFTARCLAEDHNRRVLFLDLDVQGNSSYTLKEFDSGISSSEIMLRDLTNSEIERLNGMLQPKSSVLQKIKLHYMPNIALLKASGELVNDQGFVLQSCKEQFERNISQLSYDTVIIDTPPTLGNKLILALLLSYNVFIPLELEAFSFLGLGSMITTINNMQKTAGSAKITGLIVNKVIPSRVRQRKYYDELVQSSLQPLMLKTEIPYRDCIAAALADCISLSELRNSLGYVSPSYKKARIDFLNLTDEIVRMCDEH